MREEHIAGPCWTRCRAIVDIDGLRRVAPELGAAPDDVRRLLIGLMDSSAANLEALPERNVAAHVVLIPEGGHMVHVEAAQTVAGHVSSFLAQL